jgi:hypothetical protein
MKVQSLHKACGFITEGVSFGRLCDYISQVPGVAFIDRRRFFWGHGDMRAEFKFKNNLFTVSTDAWDDALWVKPKEADANHPEILEIQDFLEKRRDERQGIIEILTRIFRHNPG